jgi:hypothetical protein
MAQTNSTILTHAYLEGTTDFQQRVSNPTQAGYARAVADLEAPMNGDIWNHFANTLNNTIGQSLISSERWYNPYERMRLANLRYGNSIRTIMVNWLKQHAYSDTSKDLLDVNKPEFVQWFYSVNYEEKIPWDMNRPELLRAMHEGPDSMGINDLYYATTISALNSDSYSIYNTCNQCFYSADENWEGGLFRIKVDAGTTKKDLAMNLLEAIRGMIYKLAFPSQLYNHVNVPVFANTGTGGNDYNELMMFTDAETMAAIEVRAYAELFNVTEAEMRTRNMVLPEMPLAGGGVLGALTTDAFIHWHDTVYGIFPFFNPDTLNDKFVLHHQAVVAPNPGVPVAVFDQHGMTLTPVVKMTAASIALNPESTTVAPGGTVDLNPELKGTVDENDGGVGVLPDSATYSVTTNNGTINTRTYVDRFGTLHVQKTGLPDGAQLTVTAEATYINPSKQENRLSTTAQITIKEPDNPKGTCMVSYDLTADTTYGIPSDAPAPDDMIADAGVTVYLAAPLTTAWTTSDGTEGGVAGTWTFTGWSTSSSYTPIATKVDNIEADTTIYGKWVFAAS